MLRAEAAHFQDSDHTTRLAEVLPGVIALAQDGWEILQRLTNHRDTHAIPVVMCSILRVRQLAHVLGAAAFLEKPVDEADFLSVLDALTASAPNR